MPILTKLIDLAICALFKWIGELWQRLVQIIGIPCVLVGSMFYISHDWWIVLSILSWIPIDLGYKDYGKIDEVARAAWLAAICFTMWLVPTIRGHLDIVFPYTGYVVFVAYIALAGASGRWFRAWNNDLGAPLNGLVIGLPIILFH